MPKKNKRAGSNMEFKIKDKLGIVHRLEKEMATHSSVLAWRIPGTGEPGGLPSMGSHRVGHDWSDLAAAGAAAVHRQSRVLPLNYLQPGFIHQATGHLWKLLNMRIWVVEYQCGEWSRTRTSSFNVAWRSTPSLPLLVSKVLFPGTLFTWLGCEKSTTVPPSQVWVK